MIDYLNDNFFEDNRVQRIQNKIFANGGGGGGGGGGDIASDVAGPGHGMSNEAFSGWGPGADPSGEIAMGDDYGGGYDLDSLRNEASDIWSDKFSDPDFGKSGVSTTNSGWTDLMREAKNRGVGFGDRFGASWNRINEKLSDRDTKGAIALMGALVPGTSLAVFSGAALSAALQAMGIKSSGNTNSSNMNFKLNDYYVQENGQWRKATGAEVSGARQGEQLGADSLQGLFGGDDMQSFNKMISKYNTTAVEQAIKAITDVDTDIQYNHTLAELSGIGLDDQEKEYYATQKNLAINRALDEIEDVYIPEGESIVAQQVYNLGENALGGTIGREFINRWQERYGKAKTTALNEIESTFLAAEQSAIDRNKQNQINIWDKQFDADVKEAELGLEKAKSNALIQYDWDSKNLDRYVTMRGQDVSAEQAELDRILKERLGDQEYSAWKDSNKWNAVGSIGSSIISSWF